MLQVQNVLLITHVKTITKNKSPHCQITCHSDWFSTLWTVLKKGCKKIKENKERTILAVEKKQEYWAIPHFSATGLLCDLGQIIYLPVPQSLIYDKIEVAVTSPLIGIWIPRINGQAWIAQSSWDTVKRIFQMPKWLPSTQGSLLWLCEEQLWVFLHLCHALSIKWIKCVWFNWSLAAVFYHLQGCLEAWLIFKKLFRILRWKAFIEIERTHCYHSLKVLFSRFVLI